jgi:hypothetical protein
MPRAVLAAVRGLHRHGTDHLVAVLVMYPRRMAAPVEYSLAPVQ